MGRILRWLSLSAGIIWRLVCEILWTLFVPDEANDGMPVPTELPTKM